MRTRKWIFGLVAIAALFAAPVAFAGSHGLNDLARHVVERSHVAHRCGGYFRYESKWVPPVYRSEPYYDACGRFLGYRKVLVRAGYWHRERVWVPCRCGFGRFDRHGRHDASHRRGHDRGFGYHRYRR